jgi:hypothetical protein
MIVDCNDRLALSEYMVLVVFLDFAVRNIGG